MKPYILSLAAGLLVGIVYSLLQVRSPAPPLVALAGLLGILIGEQAPPAVKTWLCNEPVPNASFRHVWPNMFGSLPIANQATDPTCPPKRDVKA